MKDTIAEQILTEHLVEGKLEEGAEIGLAIDQTLTQDATGTMVYLEFETLGIPTVQSKVAVSYVDHNILQADSRNPDDHRYLQSCAEKFGVIFSPPGNGVSHHVHRQRFGIPGQTLLGADSHTTTGGCLGMLAMGAGGVEVALAMAGHPYYINTPQIWGFYVEGRFQPFVSGKDLILELLRQYTCKAGIGKIMEFFGPGVANLDMSARATIANMAVDMGFTAGIFPSDEITKQWLTQNGREHVWRELHGGPNPQWDRVTEINLDEIEPMVACPSNPDNVKRAAELSDVEVQQVIIGSSCNGSYRDFMIAARIVEGRTRHTTSISRSTPGAGRPSPTSWPPGASPPCWKPGRASTSPAASDASAWARPRPPGPIRFAPSRETSRAAAARRTTTSTSVRPETAAASALTGRITDPRTLGEAPTIPMPRPKIKFRDDWFIHPPQDRSDREIIRGPNIKPLPNFGPLEDSLDGPVLIKVGDNISTDIIMPAGSRVLPYRSNIPAISDFVFEVIDPGLPSACPGERRRRRSSAARITARVPPASTRPWPRATSGVRVKIVKSFARIHKANLVNFGILPLEFADPADYDSIEPGDLISLDGIREAIEAGDAGDPCAGQQP